MSMNVTVSCLGSVALLAEGVDRNYEAIRVIREMLVALLAEGVDRNDGSGTMPLCAVMVALLAEGVDRHGIWPGGFPCRPKVALLAEGVDRNQRPDRLNPGAGRRPPRGGRG